MTCVNTSANGLLLYDWTGLPAYLVRIEAGNLFYKKDSIALLLTQQGDNSDK